MFRASRVSPTSYTMMYIHVEREFRNYVPVSHVAVPPACSVSVGLFVRLVSPCRSGTDSSTLASSRSGMVGRETSVVL